MSGAQDERAPRSAEQALRQAGRHARVALAEAVLATRCLLDAAALAATGVPAEAHGELRGLARWLERAAQAAASPDEHDPGRWLVAVAEALDAEIRRWEARSHADPEARAVLRAFLGVRELLWEFGLHRAAGADRAGGGASRRSPHRPAPSPARERPRRTGTGRLERVPVDGADAAGPARQPG